MANVSAGRHRGSVLQSARALAGSARLPLISQLLPPPAREVRYNYDCRDPASGRDDSTLIDFSQLALRTLGSCFDPGSTFVFHAKTRLPVVGVTKMSIDTAPLAVLGWRATHSQQLSVEEFEISFPARIASMQKSMFSLIAAHGHVELHAPRSQEPLSARFAVGDWLLIERESHRVLRRLEPYSCLERVAAGREARRQLIAANVDTLFVTTSCNEDFNLSRLERYLALAHESRVSPVVVLSKADLCEDVARLTEAISEIAPLVPVVPVNALESTSVVALEPWLGAGQTVAFVGSSGVGKSTLTNTLCAQARQSTAGIREHDSKGRHTTTGRHLIAMPSGAWLIDTPGMRELNLGDATQGIERTFADISELARHCRFRDCSHREEAGCAVIAAVRAGQLDERRIANYLKLQREAAHANATTAERRDRERRFGRMRHEMERQRRKMRDGR